MRAARSHRIGRTCFKSIVTSIAAACCLHLAPTLAAEIATDPGDYAALPAGVDLAIVYAQHTERNAYFSRGSKVPGGFGLDTDIGLLRWVHFTKIGDFVADPQIIVPFGSVRLNTAFGPLAPVSASGVGDPLIGGTVWLMNRAEEKQWFGVSAFVSVPVGNYDGDRGPVNVGENRWKGIFQAGYVTALPGDFMLDLIGEYSIYGENDDFFGMKRKQDPGYGLQAHLRYMISPATYVAMSWYQDYGGETKVAGVSQDDRMNNGRWLATFATFVAPTVQVQAQVGKAVSVDNGARESSRLNLRLVKVF